VSNTVSTAKRESINRGSGSPTGVEEREDLWHLPPGKISDAAGRGSPSPLAYREERVYHSLGNRGENP
jgi:hypothetical protein